MKTLQQLEDSIPKIKRLDNENIYLTLEIDPWSQNWVAEYKNNEYEVVGEGSLSAFGDTVLEALNNLDKKLGESK